jgi:hypothetical protein
MDMLDFEDKRGAGGYDLYIENSSAPLTAFLFALPLFIVYHAGLWWLNTFAGLKWANAIDIAIADFLGKLGMAGPLLSFILVVIVFLTMHALTGKPWRRPPFHTWLLMIVESLVMALPVFLLSQIVAKLRDYLPLALVDDSAGPVSWQGNLVLSCGAGAYEEFFFRILVMGALLLVFRHVLRIQGKWTFILAAVLQAVLFSLTHHLPGGPEQIADIAQARAALPAFMFRTVAGIYFAGLYFERGFGIAAGAHAGYDLMIVTLEALTPMEY